MITGLIPSEALTERDFPETIRGILIKSAYDTYNWIWSVGDEKIHDVMFAESGFDKLYARFRNQPGHLPRVEFEPECHIEVPLRLLLCAGIDMETPMNIQKGSLRYMSIKDYLVQTYG